ncbi:hypothetical protein SAMN04489760_110116 [Syntrophus gentianae]|uniref:Uncharacterized protein n=1 Tax=Syntrophus gentianae TaxID=43775 RepID=A0A1H7XGX2_9BACT|nr:hypothetical protein [Syntrophus gentianae]SEM32981.1 hypothetical protein SAMN04489760_110116 [Syntrophus gentianae]
MKHWEGWIVTGSTETLGEKREAVSCTGNGWITLSNDEKVRTSDFFEDEKCAWVKIKENLSLKISFLKRQIKWAENALKEAETNAQN